MLSNFIAGMGSVLCQMRSKIAMTLSARVSPTGMSQFPIFVGTMAKMPKETRIYDSQSKGNQDDILH